jgi:hypothetical protein
MKTLSILFLVFSLSVHAQEASPLRPDELALLNFNDQELQPITTEALKVRDSDGFSLGELAEAYKGYRKWKKENPQLAEEAWDTFNSVQDALKDTNSTEHSVMKRALEICKTDQTNCTQTIKSNLSSIYSRFNRTTYSKKIIIDIVPKAYASNDILTSCEPYSNAGSVFYALLGSVSACGITYAGLGFQIAAFTFVGRICIGENAPKVNGYGVAAGLNLFIGTSLGITVGGEGICQFFSFNGLAIGGFVGLMKYDGTQYNSKFY